jgi:hypothetical protein
VPPRRRIIGSEHLNTPPECIRNTKTQERLRNNDARIPSSIRKLDKQQLVSHLSPPGVRGRQPHHSTIRRSRSTYNTTLNSSHILPFWGISKQSESSRACRVSSASSDAIASSLLRIGPADTTPRANPDSRGAYCMCTPQTTTPVSSAALRCFIPPLSLGSVRAGT